MKKNHPLLTMLIITLISLPVIYLAIVYKNLPAIVPLHFNYKLEPDRMDDKSELWVAVLILAGASIFLFFILQNLNLVDPKRKNSPNSPVFNKMAIGLVIFLTAVNFMVITSASKGASVFNNFLFPLLGLLFAFIGNYMINIKPNYFAGFRLPWTLNDDDNWRRTHQLGGRLWFWAGIIFAVISLFIPAEIVSQFLIILIIIITVIPAVYSYRIFKNKR